MSDGLKGVESTHMWHLSSMSVLNLALHEFTRIALYQIAQMKAPFFLLLISSQTLPHLSFKRGNEHVIPCHLLMTFLVVKPAPTNYNNIATFPWLPYQMTGVNVNRIISSNVKVYNLLLKSQVDFTNPDWSKPPFFFFLCNVAFGDGWHHQVHNLERGEWASARGVC